MKKWLKAAAQGALAGLAPAIWKHRADQLLVLMYHRVLPDSHPDRAAEQPGMYVSPETFAMHLQVLKRHFTLVHLDDWMAAAARGEAIERACAITFDDGWRDNFDHAFPLLRQAGAPATIYLVADLIGTRYSFWPNALARLLLAGRGESLARLPGWLRTLLPDAKRRPTIDEVDRIIAACKSRTDEEMQRVVRAAAPDADDASRDIVSWDEIDEMRGSGLVRFGSHTRQHTRMSSIRTSAELSEEIVGSRDALGQRLGYTPTTFCYPNGEVTAPASALVRSSYQGAVTTRRGWNARGCDRHELMRVGVHEDVAATPAAFMARLTGFG